MTDKTHASRQARYRENMRNRGLVQVNEFLPRDRVQEFKDMAREARKQHEEGDQ